MSHAVLALGPQAGHKGYKGVSRNVDPIVCPMNALALYFFARFTMHAEPFPDPNDIAAW
jgi:hypothetical protein